MAISHHPENKFAFLFTGSADPQYVADLRKVTETLIRFYNYPAANITVVAGAAVAEFVPSTPPDPNNIFETPWLVPYVLGTDNPNLLTDLTNHFETFLGFLETQHVEGYNNSVFLYFTGEGDIITSDPPYYYLTIGKSGTNSIKIDQRWLKGELLLLAASFGINNFNILMQQSHSYGFFEGSNGISSIANMQITFTSACNSLEDIDSSASGSSFTDFWTKGLQFVARSGGVYADQEDTATTTPPDPVSEDTGNFLISYKKAWCFAKAQIASGMTPMFDFRGVSLDNPGLPYLIVRDGPSGTDSPDINVLHPSNPAVSRTQYLYDSGTSSRNKISVNIELKGTHCIRSYCINLGIFRSVEQVSVDEPLLKVRDTVPGIRKPGEIIPPETFNTLMLSEADYNCIVARVTTKCNSTFAGTTPVNPAANDNEAQLYITMYEEDFLCSVNHADESPAGAGNGSITIVASGGVPFPPIPPGHYEYKIDTGPWVASNQFTGCSGGIHTVSARDSAGHSCSQDVDISYSPTVQTCQTLLDNRYVNICRNRTGGLKCTFKPFPLLRRGYYRTRSYKIRWIPPVPNVHIPVIPDSELVEYTNVEIASTGRQTINRTKWNYMIIRVLENRTGEIYLKYPKVPVTGIGMRITIPVRISYKRIFGVWPPRFRPWEWEWRWPWDWRLSWPWRWPFRWRWPWLWPFTWWRLVARFRLIVVPQMYDIEEI